MRFFVPLALLGATTVMAADQTPEQILGSVIPQCLQSCFRDAFQSASGCSLDDVDCLCSADGEALSDDNISSAADQLQTCAMESSCTPEDLSSISPDDIDSAVSQSQGLCSDTGAAITFSPTNALIGAGAMMIIAAI